VVEEFEGGREGIEEEECMEFAFVGWDDHDCLVIDPLVGRWMMGIFSAIASLFALTPEQEVEHSQLMKEYGIEPYTASEIRRMESEDDANYIANIRGCADRHRSFWYTNDGHTLNWQETVIDQHGHEVVVDSGSHYVGFSGWGGDIETIKGQIVEDEPFIVYIEKKGWF